MLTSAVQNVLYKNKYDLIWERIMLQGLMHGPLLGMVDWDADSQGGVGSERWIGECSVDYIDIRDFFPDPAITDLEQDLEDCEYIILRLRKKKKYFDSKYPDFADKIYTTESETQNGYDNRYEGSNSNLANLYMYFHKGKPNTVPKEWKERFKAKLEFEDNYYEKEKLKKMIKGEEEGLHLAIASDGVLLDYIPYYRNKDKYPFAFNVIHNDPDRQWGFGEIRNAMIPQVLHNKADEAEIEAYCRQGSGGAFY